MRRKRVDMTALRAGYATLTPREQDAFLLVVSGLLNKHVMRKMPAASVGELIRAWEVLPEDMRKVRAT